MNTQTLHTQVTRELVPDDQRLAITEKLFGIHFPLKLEPVIYVVTERMAEDYNGGYWNFHPLSNGGFYMSPSSDDVFHVRRISHKRTGGINNHCKNGVPTIPIKGTIGIISV